MNKVQIGMLRGCQTVAAVFFGIALAQGLPWFAVGFAVLFGVAAVGEVLTVQRVV